jgi:flagellar basal-body rod modification protein FlgD
MQYGLNDNPLAFAVPQNSRVVRNPDPNNPVIAEEQDMSSGANFMRLMIEQLKNQDPMSPMQSNEFTQQLAALNSVEQLISLNQTMELYANDSKLGDAAQLIGKFVEGMDKNSEFITGVVDQVELVEGSPVLRVDDKLLLLEQLFTVRNPEDVEAVEEPAGEEA